MDQQHCKFMDNLKGRVKCLGPSFVISAGSLHSTFNLSYLTIPVEESDKFHKGCKQSGKSPRIWAPTCPGGRGVLPYITYTGMCRPKGSWFWSSWFRMGYLFQRRFLERGIIFRMHESSTFVSSHLKVFKDRLLLKIRFNALTSKPLHSCCTLERSIKNWPISRTGYQF